MADRERVIIVPDSDNAGNYKGRKINKDGSLPDKVFSGSKEQIIYNIYADFPQAAIEIHSGIPEKVSTEDEDALIKALESDLARAKQGRQDKIDHFKTLQEIVRTKVKK